MTAVTLLQGGGERFSDALCACTCACAHTSAYAHVYLQGGGERSSDAQAIEDAAKICKREIHHKNEEVSGAGHTHTHMHAHAHSHS